MVAMARTMILPAAIKHQCNIALSVKATEDAGVDSAVLRSALEEFVDMVRSFRECAEMLDHVREFEEASPMRQCGYCRSHIVPAMEALREAGDRLELHVEAELWPMPVYSQLLTLR